MDYVDRDTYERDKRSERHWQVFLAALTACANDGYSKWADLINDCNNITDEAMRQYRCPEKSDG